MDENLEMLRTALLQYLEASDDPIEDRDLRIFLCSVEDYLEKEDEENRELDALNDWINSIDSEEDWVDFEQWIVGADNDK